jgi:hypothetical protein
MLLAWRNRNDEVNEACATPSLVMMMMMMMIQAKARNLFQNLKGKDPKGVQAIASIGVVFYSVVLRVYNSLACF